MIVDNDLERLSESAVATAPWHGDFKAVMQRIHLGNGVHSLIVDGMVATVCGDFTGLEGGDLSDEESRVRAMAMLKEYGRVKNTYDELSARKNLYANLHTN